MSRWAVKRLVVTQIWMREKLNSDRGQTAFEYLGIAVVIAVIIGVLAGTTDIGTKVKEGITSMINKIIAGSGK
ncbi:hypothetical protein QMK19_23495 [Streptomyces sp. H10-C2]|uniref:hypothetical protein n=1 Tax=unclassified Streptomyces TaxID=2593676 RepID=UPI0024BA5AF4|nr:MULTISPECIES: hypothetical protein [unclassified Streptomyces]MDJ0342741.1 hypothetical protein [Streptomyces sp. PH10-H1]MDJ0372549.1 hypothetical protein [Streptomyces sp. H10-C2]